VLGQSVTDSSMYSQTLTLRSSIQPGSKAHNALQLPGTRPSAIASLPPLPHIFSSPLASTYPACKLPFHTETLSLPLHAIPKPPLPPRPNQRPSSSQGTPSRLTSSFASLFGKQTPSTTSLPTISTPDTEHPTEVSAFTIDRLISMKDVSLQINKALKIELRDALGSSGVPTGVIDQVHEFSTGLYPFVKDTSPAAPRRVKGSAPKLIIDPPQETPEELSKQFQDFYGGLEADMLARASPSAVSDSIDGESEKPHHKKGVLTEENIRNIMEAVERVICSLFYDRYRAKLIRSINCWFLLIFSQAVSATKVR
jgi:hypothetical protein